MNNIPGLEIHWIKPENKDNIVLCGLAKCPMCEALDDYVLLKEFYEAQLGWTQYKP